MKVLVTGAAGFIGYHLSEALLRRGDAVVGFDNIAGYINYPRSLCSVDCDYKEEAVLAVDFLRNRIHNPAMPPQKKTMPVSLVCLHSCRR